MNFVPTTLTGSYLVEYTVFQDHRGGFFRYFCKEEFAKINHGKEWVQMNHSVTSHKGTVRGMHFQHPPAAEIKMVRCIAGKIFDVIIDLRKESPTYLKWEGFVLTAEKRQALYIPEGFAHGFQTLEDNAELLYHHSEYYRPEFESGIRYDDPAVGIEWLLEPVNLSERDKSYIYINNFK